MPLFKREKSSNVEKWNRSADETSEEKRFVCVWGGDGLPGEAVLALTTQLSQYQPSAPLVIPTSCRNVTDRFS
ncbi:unnamed protein product [Thelazia callipaeda]|uniref:DAGKc domain-containing protein n=1 Tax=Thelazia callipaeda TaxID=103827 RepID=A0A0N5D6W8_THECL|nr:unnamed protein product [Thelazia callipaeda]